ncbi:hypothetical protein SESBI_47534 [Sesbania bispinosa]|nr:hypothetical protein SESBI_47534 [Sesbania bispinosa]
MRNFRPDAIAPQRRRRFPDVGGSLALPAGGSTVVEELKLDGVDMDLRQGRDVDDLLDFLGDDGGGGGGRVTELAIGVVIGPTIMKPGNKQFKHAFLRFDSQKLCL